MCAPPRLAVVPNPVTVALGLPGEGHGPRARRELSVLATGDMGPLPTEWPQGPEPETWPQRERSGREDG